MQLLSDTAAETGQRDAATAFVADCHTRAQDSCRTLRRQLAYTEEFKVLLANHIRKVFIAQADLKGSRHRCAHIVFPVVHFLLYLSSATNLFPRSELDDILGISRRNNKALGVSGILLYKDGNLMQLLEGEKRAVVDLYAKISRDPRHHDLTMIWDGTQEQRQFPSWSMAFRDLDGPDARTTPGFSEFLTTPLTGAELAKDVTNCQQLLNLFKRSM